jgi:hypothetical protein
MFKRCETVGADALGAPCGRRALDFQPHVAEVREALEGDGRNADAAAGGASKALAARRDLVRIASVRHLSKKARYDIGDRHEDEQPERRERAEERDSCS